MSPATPAAPASAAPAAAPHAELDAAWNDFFLAIRRVRGRAASTRGSELTLPQLHLLDSLDRAPGARCGELAEAAGIAPPTATRMLNGLEREGIVERSHCAEDRRAVTVALTPHGRELLESKRAVFRAKRHELFDSLSAEEREQAAHLFARMAELVDGF